MTTNREMLLATSGRDTGLETCITCKHMTMEAPLGMPYFICDIKMDMEAEDCGGFDSGKDEHEECFNKGELI